MLNLLSIRNFAIISNLELEMRDGMTVISGETGAGKSIMLDALGLALGNRSESDAIRSGSKRGEISAAFDISKLPDATDWLHKNELEAEDENECILRRTLTAEGRSRAYINGYPCPINKVRELGELLVDIHGQHEHQRLLKKDQQRSLLDNFAQAQSLCAQVKSDYRLWKAKHAELKALQEISTEASAQLQLLTYQTDEINKIDPQPGELSELEFEQRQLANAESILIGGQQINNLLVDGEDENANALLNQAVSLVEQLDSESSSIAQVNEMLSSALIQIEEAQRELGHYLQQVELNPERLREVEDRLSALYELARKHRQPAESLADLKDQLNSELNKLSHVDENLEALAEDVNQAQQKLLASATELSKLRKETSEKLASEVNKQLEQLGMGSASFQINLSEVPHSEIGPAGIDEIEFVIATNKGQSAKPLARIASGGELSRISLAIQVVTAKTANTPTLIFDEVDVGIGGGIAEVVGRLLRELSHKAQILCVTHQPQVAAQGTQHLFVSKNGESEQTDARISMLTEQQRVNEVARMLGGLEITETTLSHAKEMVDSAV